MDGQPPATPTARRTLARAFDGSGRATRSEVAHYALATLLVTVPVSLVTGLALPYAVHLLIGNALAALLAIPVPALLVRRLHDAGRSGSWAWLAVPGFALWAGRTVLAATLGIEARLQIDRAAWLLDWAVILANLAILALIVLPGSAGANRFGPDPRGRE